MIVKAHKILFPTDFSEAAHHAFIYALRMADAIGATIVTLNVYQLPEIRGAHLPNTLQQVYNSIDLENFENYRDTLPILHQIAESKGLGHIQLTNLMEEGSAVKKIVQIAAREAVDFVIMGTKGAGWLKEIFLGTVAAEVMEHAPCPVLAVPKEAEFDGKIDHILITTDLRERDVEAVNKLLKFAEPFGAVIHCVHINTTGSDDAYTKLNWWKRYFGLTPNLTLEVCEGKNFHRACLEFLDNHTIDLIAMLIEKRNFWEELFQSNKAKKFAYRGQIPVLAIPVSTLNN